MDFDKEQKERFVEIVMQVADYDALWNLLDDDEKKYVLEGD